MVKVQVIVLNWNLVELWNGSADASVDGGMVLRNPAALCLVRQKYLL